MKKYILAICCMAFACQAFAQPQTFFIHKKDGSVLELPVGPTKIDFSGKAIVNDGDYIQIDNIETLIFNGEKPYALVKTDPEMKISNYKDYERTGICYSTEPNVSITNGTVIEVSKEEYSNNWKYRERGFQLDSLDFSSTYYCRSFIYWRGNYYYSEEKSFTIGKPAMKWYGIDIPEHFAAKGIYIHPTDTAWSRLIAKDTLSFNIKNEENAHELLTRLWNEEYLTIEKAQELAVKCTDKYECEDGTIYLLDEIDDDFMNVFGDFETVMYGTVGLEEPDLKTIGPDTIICPAELNVPNNTYYAFSPSQSSVNPGVSYRIDEPMLANKEYELEVVMAPEYEKTDTLNLPSIIRISHYTDDARYVIEDRLTISATETTYLNFKIKPEYFGQNVIMIESRVSSAQANKKARRILRIARITVKSVKEE